MEGADASNHSKKSVRRSSNGHLSMSDTDSVTSQVDSWHSPLRSESLFRSDDPSFRPESDDPGENNDKAIVLVDKSYSPVPSPGKSGVPASYPAAGGKSWQRWPHSEKPESENLDIPVSTPPEERASLPAVKPLRENPAIPAKPVVGVNKFVREEPPPSAVKKVGAVGRRGGDGALEEGYGGGGNEPVGGERRSRAAVSSILKRSGKNVTVRRLALAFRVFELSCISDDINRGVLFSPSTKAGGEGLRQLLDSRNTRFVPFDAWGRIDSEERRRGSLEELLEVACG